MNEFAVAALQKRLDEINEKMGGCNAVAKRHQREADRARALAKELRAEGWAIASAIDGL